MAWVPALVLSSLPRCFRLESAVLGHVVRCDKEMGRHGLVVGPSEGVFGRIEHRIMGGTGGTWRVQGSSPPFF